MKPYPLIIGLALVSGCASPGFRYHTLQPASDPSTPPTLHDQVHLTVVQIPAEVDTEQLVIRANNNTLMREPTDRWAAPLNDEIRAALVDAWRRDDGLDDVPGAEENAHLIPQVGLQVQKLDATLGGNVELVAQWQVSVGVGNTTKTLSCQQVISEPAPSSIDGVVDAEQRAIRALAGDIAATVKRVHNQQAPVCPGPG